MMRTLTVLTALTLGACEASWKHPDVTTSDNLARAKLTTPSTTKTETATFALG